MKKPAPKASFTDAEIVSRKIAELTIDAEDARSAMTTMGYFVYYVSCINDYADRTFLTTYAPRVRDHIEEKLRAEFSDVEDQQKILASLKRTNTAIYPR